MIRLGITGTRIGANPVQLEQMKRLIAALKEVGSGERASFHHGDCKGVDAQGMYWAKYWGYWIVSHPPIETRMRAYTVADETWEPAAYKTRNCHIVDNVDRMIGVPKGMQEEFRGSGTWHAIRYARRMEKPLYLVWPNGTVTAELVS